jgi:hypothetical protein
MVWNAQQQWGWAARPAHQLFLCLVELLLVGFDTGGDGPALRHGHVQDIELQLFNLQPGNVDACVVCVRAADVEGERDG